MANNHGEHGLVPKTTVDGFDSNIGHIMIIKLSCPNTILSPAITRKYRSTLIKPSIKNGIKIYKEILGYSSIG